MADLRRANGAAMFALWINHDAPARSNPRERRFAHNASRAGFGLHAKARRSHDTATDDVLTSAIGTHLRKLYGRFEDEPLPRRFIELLEKLERSNDD